jgi:hypothetical protein
MTDSRFVVLVLDGLRPDLVTPERMPNLTAFRDQGAVLANCRSQYPTHTRVNKVSFATGTTPKYHGIHFNKIYDPAFFADRIVDIGNFDDIHAADARSPVITAPTIGKVLADANKRFALVHCGMPGAPWLLNYHGDRLGQEHLALGGFQYSTKKAAQLVEAKLGPMPAAGGINLDRTRYALKALTEVLYPALSPDVSLIWSDEPDKSEHADGLRGPLTESALRQCDEIVGDMIAWWRTVAERDNVNLLIVSDHGHVEISGRVAVANRLAEAGLPVTADAAKPGAVIVPFGSGGIYLRDQDTSVLEDIVAWLQKQDWCGNLFTRDRDGVNGMVAGTFSTALASIDHPRAPDLLFTTRRFDANAADGHPLGHCIDTGSGAVAGSTHGGLHREELRNCLFAAGPNFRSAYRSQTSGGLLDLVPTMLQTMGIARPETMAGRPLGDLLVDGTAPEDAGVGVETVSVTAGGYSQHIAFKRLARRNVMEHGWRE